MRTTLRLLLAMLGVSAVGIALGDMLAGGAATAGFFEHLFAALTGWRGPDSGPWPPTMDNELRFYAAMWGGYGILLLFVAKDWRARQGLVPWLAALFFAGGLGRALSCIAIGPPHPLFIVLMWIELLLPPILVVLWWRVRGPI
ncbi:MAG: DUF4345 domain-containing protein [Phenylobacterium sp.]|nr:MAG: DUF4345 domain-containing protein [Phenylobacterium sp.]